MYERKDEKRCGKKNKQACRMIFDTSFLIDIMQNDRDALLKLSELIKKNEPQGITVISVFELYTGILRSNKPDEEKEKVERVLKGQELFGLDEESAKKAGIIDGKLFKRGQIICIPDGMIAGIALTKNQKVLTRNIKDFAKIDGLEIETY